MLRETKRNGGRMTGVAAGSWPRSCPGHEGQPGLDRAGRRLATRAGPDGDTFRVVDLLMHAVQGEVAVINPLGDMRLALLTPTPRAPGDEPVVPSAMT